jgi:hypothetical protein
MAKRRASNRKSKAEEKVERITWFLLVLIFAAISIARDNLALEAIPNWFIPTAGAIVLLGSGMYQYSKNWRVSPITWLTGTILLMFALVNILVEPALNLTGLSLLAFAAVILFGLLTGET